MAKVVNEIVNRFPFFKKGTFVQNADNPHDAIFLVSLPLADRIELTGETIIQPDG